MTNPRDQLGALITAVILFGNVMLRLWPAITLLVESMQFRKMTLGLPLLSIIRNAVEWLAASKESVTLLLSDIENIFSGDTETYRKRSATQTSSILTFAYIFESFLIVMKPMLPVDLSVIWMPN